MSDPRSRPVPAVLVAAVPLPGDHAHDVAARDLDSRLRVFEKSARRVRRGKDDRAVHDLRVASRRLETALRLWKPTLLAGPARTARREARHMRRAFTKPRDFEMLRSEWQARARNAAPELRVVLETMIARIERRLATASNRARWHASRKRVARIARAISRAVGAGGADRAASSASRLADRHVRSMRERALQSLAHGFAERSDESLHRARIQVKKWRYAEECEIALHEERSSTAVVGVLKSLQDSLGRVHDLAVAGDACARRARKSERQGERAATEALRGLAETIGREREAAIAEAQRLATTLRRADPPAERAAD